MILRKVLGSIILSNVQWQISLLYPGNMSGGGICTFDKTSLHVCRIIIIVVVTINIVTVRGFLAHCYNDSRVAQTVQFPWKRVSSQILIDLYLHAVGRVR